MPALKNTSWGNVAGWYDELLKTESTYQQEVILPNLVRRMDLKKGERVLDLACGQGFFSFEFSKAGAEVIGADISPELIRLAQKRVRAGSSRPVGMHAGGRGNPARIGSLSQVDGIAFHAAPADKVPFVADRSIDQLTIVLAIQNIENVKAVFAECARVLAPNGRMHLVMNHPAFRVPKASDWGWDEMRKTQYRRVGKYLSEQKIQIQMHPGAKPGEMTLSFHRPLQYFFKLLAKEGFCVSGLEEWVSNKRSDSGPRARAENRARAEIPLFLYLEACKK